MDYTATRNKFKTEKMQYENIINNPTWQYDLFMIEMMTSSLLPKELAAIKRTRKKFSERRTRSRSRSPPPKSPPGGYDENNPESHRPCDPKKCDVKRNLGK